MSLYDNYWGKAKPGSETQFHRLAFHCLDVAAVGRAYLQQYPRLLQFLSQTLDADQASMLDWFTFLFTLHDLGKFAESFQSQREDIFERLHGRKPKLITYNTRHDSLGAWLWGSTDTDHHLSSQLAKDWPWLQTHHNGVEACIRAVTGHHGMPPIERRALNDHFSCSDEAAARVFVQDMAALLLPETTRLALATINRKAFTAASKKLSWWLAGVAVLADWLGSNTEFFIYHDQVQDLGSYWAYAQRQAGKALQQTGVLPQQAAIPQAIKALFPYVKIPTPLQVWAHQAPLPVGPQLHILEDVTGAGKTEAAVILAQRLLAVGHADGLFFALPTMATANAMYHRLAPIGGKLFAAGQTPSTVLAHGQRKLDDVFNAAILPAAEAEHDSAQQDETASARCNAWLADSNKKALLANVGVGTIDQALLAVLHAKHQSLRLLGLFGKVLVVDEVHACDAYVLKLLCVVLRFHAASGGSAILLSATLPQAMKQKLLDAYADGLGIAAPSLQSQAFPLAITFSPEGVIEQSLDTRLQVARTVFVETLDVREQVIKRITNALDAGHCVAWVRNTIADVLDAYDQCAPLFGAENILIFHARFAMGDRLEIESELEERFGTKSTHEQRKGRLLLASQVAEQSLDVDFDVLISDLAPIDRLIQRAGRMHRHVRDTQGNPKSSGADERGTATLIVYAPTWSDDPPANWFKASFVRSQKVYANHAQLWLTQRELRSGSYQMPEDGRRLIEAVYGEDATLPKGLQATALAAEGDAMGQNAVAHDNALKLPEGYAVGVVADWWRDTITPTRLGEATTTVRLAIWRDGKLLPLCRYGRADKHDWALSQVRVYEKYLKEEHLPAATQAAAETLKASLPDGGRWSVLLVLTDNETQGWQGSAKDAQGTIQSWRYDRKFGLRLLKETQREKS